MFFQLYQPSPNAKATLVRVTFYIWYGFGFSKKKKENQSKQVINKGIIRTMFEYID